MTIERKLLSTSPSGGATDVAKVFSVDLWDNEGSSATITSGLDSTDSDVMIWAKQRDGTGDHYLADTVRGITKYINPNSYSAESTSSGVFASTSSTGYTTGDVLGGSTQSYVGWQFKKKKKFFDIVTYTGNGVAGRTVAHNLGSVPGMMIVRNLAQGYSWQVYHRSMANNDRIELDNSGAKSTGQTTYWNSTTPTSSVFTLGTQNQVNEDGDSFVAYLFADNSSEDADDQMIKCGSYAGTGNNGLIINLGWEPQFVLIKNYNLSRDWVMVDNMRGWATGSVDNSDARLYANTAAAESTLDNIGMDITSTGFELDSNAGADLNRGGDSCIYMAIRAPMMVEPEAATDVFSLTNTTGAVIHNVGLVPDMAIWTNTASSGNNRQLGARLIGDSYLRTNTNGQASNAGQGWDEKTGYWQNPNHAANINLLWKRAKGYMDVVAYTGTGSSKNESHSLGVAPEMMWVKKRSGTEGWAVYHKLNGGTHFLRLEGTAGYVANNGLWNNTDTTASVFRVGSDTEVNQSGQTYLALLFATLAGISKVGSYTGNGSSQTIDCGFSAGARFILVKRTDNSLYNWYAFDTIQGIVAGNDPHFQLDTGSNTTNIDVVDPHSSGFIVNNHGEVNSSGGTYIFYAIA